MTSVLPATIGILHQVYVFDGGTNARGNPTGALADPVPRKVIAFYRLDWASGGHDPISIDFVARTIADLIMLVPDPTLYKKLDRVLLNSGAQELVYDVQNVPISWSKGFMWQRYSPLLAGEVHIRRVQ